MKILANESLHGYWFVSQKNLNSGIETVLRWEFKLSSNVSENNLVEISAYGIYKQLQNRKSEGEKWLSTVLC
jgi:hypothetical protein